MDNYNIFPCSGDFSFIINNFYKDALTHDYNLLCNCKLWRYLNIKDDIMWVFIKEYSFKNHTDESFKHSMAFLQFILNNGWCEFVIKFMNEGYIYNFYKKSNEMKFKKLNEI